jgi:hypothetical protein
MNKGFARRMYDKMRKDIATMGQSMLGVLGDKNTPPFIYTIGNAERGLPELLIIGAADNSIGDVLNVIGEKMRERGRPFDNGELINIGGKFPLKAINTTPKAKEDYTIQAGQYLGHEDYAVQQLLIPDKHGRFPGDPKCEEPFASCPLLSPALN